MNLALPRFFDKYRSGDLFYLGLVFLAVVALVAPVAALGIPDGKDLGHHLKFAQVYYEALSNGDFQPGWAAGDNFGFGQAGVRFYPPLAYYALGGTRILTGNWFDAVWINFFFWMLLGSVGVYFWAKEWLSPAFSASAAALYAAAPYHLSQIYQTWLYAEFVAAAVLPFCFLYAARLCRRRAWSDALLLAAAVALLTLSHIPMTIIGGLSLAVFVFCLVDRRAIKETFPKFVAAAVLSLGMSLFHWIKVVTEVDWVLFNTRQYSSGYYDFRNHIFPLFAGGEFYAARLLWFFDAMFVLTALFFLPAVVYLIFKFRSEGDRFFRRSFVAAGAAGTFSLLMASAASAFLWGRSELLQKLQFPWRWLSVASLAGVIIFCAAIERLAKGGKAFQKAAIYLALIVLLPTTLFNLTQNILTAAAISRTDFPQQAQVLLEEGGCPCWFPVWGTAQAFKNKEKVSANGREVEILSWEAETREFKIAAGAPVRARVATLYYPHWKAEIDGAAANVEPDEHGAVTISVGGAESVVKMYFEEPAMVTIAVWISLFSWTIFLAALIYAKRREARPVASSL